tara:strand:+ start:465 stop:833 length:369 start_codon:yes stop_codon:yes gene_type:complete
MAYFATIDENNIVKRVEVVENDIATTEQAGIEFLKQLHGSKFNFKQMGEAPFVSNGETITRKNYAGINYTYDESRNAFIQPKPFNSWILNETNCKYEPPIAPPDDGKRYEWNEETTSWDLLE